MTKKECVNILKNNYTVELASQTPEGALEILRFTSEVSSDYVLHFLNGRLVEYYKHVQPPKHQPHPRGSGQHRHNHNP